MKIVLFITLHGDYGDDDMKRTETKSKSGLNRS